MLPDLITPSWIYWAHSLQFLAYGEFIEGEHWKRFRDLRCPIFRDANHVAVQPGALLEMAELAELVAQQRAEGALPCLDLYEEDPEQISVIRALGFEPEESAFSMMTWRARPRLATEGTADAEMVAKDQWSEVQRKLHDGPMPAWVKHAVSCESAFEHLTPYASYRDCTYAAGLVRYDWETFSQIETVFTHPHFRRRGAATDCLRLALSQSPHPEILLFVSVDNSAAQRLYESLGASLEVVRGGQRWFVPT
ncbi:MAG: GNAT family N-acetyltransferase [Myxococcales bacterium]|nr:GNAT family N-acetyltransferase [Myxococcales bacterium]